MATEEIKPGEKNRNTELEAGEKQGSKSNNAIHDKPSAQDTSEGKALMEQIRKHGAAIDEWYRVAMFGKRQRKK